MSLLDKFQYGCTGISWLMSWFGRRLPGHECCDEHDVAYSQGGSLAWKVQMDAKMLRCIAAKNNNSAWGWTKATAAWLAVTVIPYSYVVWYWPENTADFLEREINRE